MDRIVRRMVDLAAGLEFEHLPASAVHAAKARLIDSMGVAMAASDAPPVSVARRVAQPTAGRYKSRLLGTGTATTSDMAAFVNGIMVRYLDFNDAYRTRDASHLHPTSTLGTDISQLEAVQTGFIDITSNATAQFSAFSTDFEFVGLPYAITDWDMADRLYKSDLWKEQAASFEKSMPVKVLPPLGSGGFRLLWNNVRPLPSPDAVQGLKFRTTRSPLSIDLIKA